MSARIVLLPGQHRRISDTALDPCTDPNLSKNFSAEEIRGVWEKLESLAVAETITLLERHNPTIRSEMSKHDYAVYVADIAAFFFTGAANRATMLPHLRASLFALAGR